MKAEIKKMLTLIALFLVTSIYCQEKDQQSPSEKILVYEGTTNLYVSPYTGFTTTPNGSFTDTEYHVQTKGREMVKIFPVGLLGNGTNKAIKKYFNDCPRLGKLIDQEAFTRSVGNDPDLSRTEKFRKRLIEIVKYYDSKCSLE